MKEKIQTSFLRNRTIDQVTSKDEPAFIYDKNVLTENISKVRQLIGTISTNEVSIYLSVKCNPNINLLQIASESVDGFDVSSFKELELALRTNVTKKISFSGPNKTTKVIKQINEHKCDYIHFDSLDEINR